MWTAEYGGGGEYEASCDTTAADSGQKADRETNGMASACRRTDNCGRRDVVCSCSNSGQCQEGPESWKRQTGTGTKSTECGAGVNTREQRATVKHCCCFCFVGSNAKVSLP